MSEESEIELSAAPLELPDVMHIDMALSGGGFRATLFHLGIVGFLREHHLLNRVRNIFSVSGGSVLAAHLVIYWNDYIGDDESAFKNRVRHLVESIRMRDVSGSVLQGSEERLIKLRPLDSELLVSEYRNVLGSEERTIRRWDDLDGKPGLPQLHILATHLNTGRAGAYTVAGFRIPRVPADQRHAQEINAFAEFAEANNIRHQDIARAVAASSAFPPAFSPIALVEGNTSHLLTDGGVYDNSGVNYLKDELYGRLGVDEAKNRLVIMSDAGREFPTELGQQYDTFLDLAMRVTDTQGNRIANSDSSAAEAFFREKQIPVLRLSIHDTVEHFQERPTNHSERVQELLGTIRTELDSFSAEEIFALYRHGYLVVQKAYAEYQKNVTGVDLGLAGVPWAPEDDDHHLSALDRSELESRLKRSHIVSKQANVNVGKFIRRRYRRWIRLAIAIVVATGLLLPSVGYYLGSRVPASPAPVAPRGVLAIAESEPYRPDSWAAAIPTLTPVLRSNERRYVYTVATTPLVKPSARATDHAGALLKFKLTGGLGGAQVYLFLKQEISPGNVQYVVLEEASTRKLKVPPGRVNDRICGVVISQTKITALNTVMQQDLTIELEEP